MEFIELTNPDYKRLAVRRVLISPFITPLWRYKAILFSLILLASVYLALRYGIDRSDIPASVMILQPVFWVALIIFYVLDIIGAVIGLIVDRSLFVTKVKQLEGAQYQALLSEYPNAVELDICSDKKKRLAGIRRIFVTDSFLYVPGLFLVSRNLQDSVFARSVATWRSSRRMRHDKT